MFYPLKNRCLIIFIHRKFLKNLFFEKALKIISKPILDYKMGEYTSVNGMSSVEKAILITEVEITLGEKILRLPEISVEKQFLNDYSKLLLTLVLVPNKEEKINIFVNAENSKYDPSNWIRKVFVELFDDLFPNYQMPGLNLYIKDESASLANEHDLTFDLYWFLKDYLLRSNYIKNI